MRKDDETMRFVKNHFPFLFHFILVFDLESPKTALGLKLKDKKKRKRDD